MEERNAIIEAASVFIEDYGMLTAYVYLDYGGSAQGFGGWALQLSRTSTHWKQQGLAGLFIMRVLEVAGVDAWEKLKGKTVRVRADYDRVHAIGHIVKDDWFNPSEEFAEVSENA